MSFLIGVWLIGTNGGRGEFLDMQQSESLRTFWLPSSFMFLSADKHLFSHFMLRT